MVWDFFNELTCEIFNYGHGLCSPYVKSKKRIIVIRYDGPSLTATIKQRLDFAMSKCFKRLLSFLSSACALPFL